MYKIATVLRTSQAPNIFRRAILGAFSGDTGDEYLLCSGFFQERKYKVSSYFSSDSFIKSAPSIPCRVSITTVGVYDWKVWGQQYDAFAAALGTIACQCGRPIAVRKRKRKGGNKWHAKVFMARRQGLPTMAIVGSSNITRNAFDEMKGWNRECDVLIWNSAEPSVDATMREALSGDAEAQAVERDREGAPDVFVSSYDADDPLNARRGSMQGRLSVLWQDVIDASVAVG